MRANLKLKSGHADDALRDSEARYRRLFETAQDGILILDAHSGLITDVNPFLTTLLNYSREDFLGKTLWDIGAFGQIQQSKDAFRELQNKEYIRYDNLPLKTRSGRRINVEFVSNVYEERGKSVIQCNIRDITARKQGEASLHVRQSEDALRLSEERFSKAFRNNPLAITISTEAEGRYLDVNEAFLDLLGYQRKDVIGRSAEELHFWAEPLDRADMIRQLKGEQKAAKHQMRYRTAKGKIREAEVWAELIEVDGQSCVLAITRDVTEMMQLEAQLRQAQKMEAVGRLAGGIAHDFNNVLSIVIGYSDLSLALLAPENPLNHHVLQIKKAAERAALLTNQLLGFSRKQVVFPRTLDLNEVVRNATEMFLRLVGEDIAVEFRPTAPLSTIKADRGQLEQVLMNLVVNARDAMPTGGRIIIETGEAELDEDHVSLHRGSHAGRYVVLAVSDTGCGMDETIQSQIFEPFFTTKGVGRGTGLGLSTVYGIVKQSEGNILVYSERGKGTTFKVYFPRAGGIPEALPLLKDDAEPRGGSETILVVEDDKTLRELTVRLLCDAGYRVIEATDGEEAIRIMATSGAGIDLLLTDVIMPAKSGPELVKQVKNEHPKTRFVFMSGYSGDMVKRHGLLMQEDSLLEKPFTKRSLLKKMYSALHREVTNVRSPPSSQTIV